MKFAKIAAVAAVAVMACGLFYGCGEESTTNSTGSISTSQVATSRDSQKQSVSLIGTWKADGVVSDSGKIQSLSDYFIDLIKSELGSAINMNAPEAKQLMAILRESFDNLTFEFKEDGTFSFTMKAQGQTRTKNYTYEAQGDIITITDKDTGKSNDLKFDAAAGTIMMDNESMGITLVLKKA